MSTPIPPTKKNNRDIKFYNFGVIEQEINSTNYKGKDH